MVVSSLPPPHFLSKFVYLFLLSSSLLSSGIEEYLMPCLQPVKQRLQGRRRRPV
jgi:hypothetical protein